VVKVPVMMVGVLATVGDAVRRRELTVKKLLQKARRKAGAT
jgi:hypothetical protein